MATNLTPQQLAELQRLFSTPVGNGNDNAYMPNTLDYGGQSWKRDDTGGFVGTGPLGGNNEYKYTNYDAGGAQTAEGEARMSDWDPLQQFLMATGALVGGGLMMGGPGAFGFGANPGYGIVGGATEPVSALGGSGAMGAGAAGGGAAGAGGALGTMAPLEQMAMPASVSEAASLSTMAGGGAGLLGKGLGIGASLLGAAAGAQGQNAEQSSTRDIPEWLKPYAQKVLGYGGSLLDQQMQPGAMAGFDQMKSAGQGLLGQPIAGNGTSLFPARPTLMRR